MRDLTNTVQTLQSSMFSLTERVNNMNRTQSAILAAAESAEQLRVTGSHIPMVRNDTTPEPCGTSDVYTLSTAWANSPSKQMGVKTTYRYSAEPLQFVETASTHLRKLIVEGRDINLATILFPYYSWSEEKEK